MSDASPDLSPTDEAALAALADGRLAARERAELEARIDADPGLAAALGRQRTALSLITGAADGTSAPLALRARIEALRAQPGRSWLGRLRDRVPAIPLTALAGATGVAAVVIALVVFGGGPGIDDVLSAAAGAPSAAIAPFPRPGQAPARAGRGRALPQLRRQVRLDGHGRAHRRDRRA